MSSELNVKKMWEKCLSIIKDNISEGNYNTWFAPIVPLSFSNKKLVIEIPTTFFYEILEERFAKLLSLSITRVFGKGVELSYSVAVVKDDETEKISISSDSSATKELSKSSSLEPSNIVPTQELDPRLNPNYSFDNFIEGETNKLSRSVALAVATDTSSTTFNPLFIHGPSGVGKTHLINAIGAKTKEIYPQKRVIYLSAHLFQVQYTDSVKHNRVNDFINFYRTIDVLLIDDIQEFSGKDKTINAFFHIFNYLRDSGKRIVITSDRHPSSLKGIEDRLITRFKWGMVAELDRPDTELRRKILVNKLRRDGIKFPDDVISYIAENVNESVRELEGVVSSLLARSTILNVDINLDLAKMIIAGNSHVAKRVITIDKILDVVCQHWGIDLDDIHKKSRKKEVVTARQTAMYLAHKYTESSTTQIGRMIGDKNHATVIYSCRLIKSQQEVDKRFNEELREIENRVTGK